MYRSGFAETQAAYEAGVVPLFAALDQLEERLASRRYLCGNQITEADWKLFVTLVRFDEVYYVHFKCNVRRIAEYENLWAYVRDLYQQPGIAETVSMDRQCLGMVRRPVCVLPYEITQRVIKLYPSSTTSGCQRSSSKGMSSNMSIDSSNMPINRYPFERDRWVRRFIYSFLFASIRL